MAKKLDLSKDGLKKLAIQHCEKAVFGVCALVLLMLLWFGYSKKTFPLSEKNPEQLVKSSKAAEQRINTTSWGNPEEEDSIASYRKPELGIADKVTEIQQQVVDSLNYPAPAFSDIVESTKPKRLMPTLLAASDLSAKFGYKYFAVTGPSGGSDKINEAIYAPEREESDQPKRPRRPSRQKTSGLPGSGGSGAGAGMQAATPSPTEASPTSMGAGPGGMGAGAGGSAATNASYPTMTVPEYLLAELEGAAISRKVEKARLMWRQVVCVTGVVPFKQQIAEYEKALKGSRKYDPANDIPKYIGLKIERRINGGGWVNISNDVQRFAKIVTPIDYPMLIDPEQHDPFLNMQIPTILAEDFDEFVVHSKVDHREFVEFDKVEVADASTPSVESRSFEDAATSVDTSDGSEETADENQLLNAENAPDFKQVRFFDLLADRAAQAAKVKQGDKIEYKVSPILMNPNLPLSFVVKNASAFRNKSGGGSMGAGGMGAAGMGNAMSGGGPGGMSGAPQSIGGQGPGGMGSGAMGATGMGAARMGAAGGGVNRKSRANTQLSAELQPDMIGNPNITDSDLAGSIRTSILKIKQKGFADFENKTKSDFEIAIEYGLISPESSPSNEVVFSPIHDRVLIGEGSPLTPRRAENVVFFDAEPTVEIVLEAADQDYQMRIPGKVKVVSGQPLVFDSKAIVLNPIDRTARWIGKPERDEDGAEIEDKRKPRKFDSSALVLDVSAPEKLANASGLKDEFLSPAEVLVFDPQFGFQLRNELEDQPEFQHATIAEGEEAETSSSLPNNNGFGLPGGMGPAGMGGAPGGMGGAGGASGFPGFNGKK